jgi:uncharacterized membrane-anchored protein
MNKVPAVTLSFWIIKILGDLATEALGLGFGRGVVVFGALLALVYTWYRMGGGAVLTFWLAYILTRPLGAALGDLLTQARASGGLGLGAKWTSAAFLLVIVALVASAQLGGRRKAKAAAAS